MFRKLLVANRGEIALRVFRTARELGIRTVAVYSDADKDSQHVLWADEAVHIGESEPSKSYLDAAKLIATAKSCGADAIHPGYGFLSERSSFSRACRDAGICFVGPSPESMDQLGAKIDAKTLAVSNGVPVTPGYFEPGAGVDELREAADRIGYPVMLKASAGGGGRGMRVVHDPANFDQEFALASEESVKAFGDGAMMVEKLIDRPRHIEVQILADRHGNVACLFERECSLQRRHQKVLEEAPSPVMTADLWARMQEASRKLVLAAGYEGAGTVEFMVDESTLEFYFLEVNARLQVEHPVTEAITGLDLVECQLRIASGQKLELSPELMAGDRTAIKGHAIEARIVAEDPSRGFLPSIGKILGWAGPIGEGVRFDTGFSKGSEVSRYYDSLVGKVITSGASRAQAISRLRSALMDTHILGVKTNVSYLLDVISHADFGAGSFDTGFLGREFGDWSPSDGIPAELLALVRSAEPATQTGTTGASHLIGAWDLTDGFRVTNRSS